MKRFYITVENPLFMYSETHDLHLLKTRLQRTLSLSFICHIDITQYMHIILPSIQRFFTSLTFPFKLLKLDCLNASLSVALLLIKFVTR